MKIAVVGAGYVGLVTGACLAEFGHSVVCIDSDTDKIELLNRGELPIFEPDLAEIVQRSVAESRLGFTTSYEASLGDVEVVFIAVGTPVSGTGEADLTAVMDVVDTLGPAMSPNVTVVLKSTVPVGTTALVADRFAERCGAAAPVVVSNPEFLKEGNAVSDFMRPDRVVVGTRTPEARSVMEEVYRSLIDAGAPFVFTDPETAELIKYASNAFLAVKLGFINEMADIADRTGASVDDVSLAMGLDARISASFLKPGPGYGGSCFPKDTQALLHTSTEVKAPSRIVAAAIDTNRVRRRAMVDRIAGIVPSGADVGVLGLAFKAGTDDLRESPAIEIVAGLVSRGFRVTAYDPEGMVNARRVLEGVSFAAGPYEALSGAAAGIILTEWPEFAQLDLGTVRARLATPTIIDLRNLFEPAVVAAAGLTYHSVGRPTAEPPRDADTDGVDDGRSGIPTPPP
ncbi:MAG: UDP-glucose/GDP-mannose dehydrogenase family protein [Acidimicrobiia bacterium]